MAKHLQSHFLRAACLVIFAFAGIASANQPQPNLHQANYTMRGTFTDLWDMDVDYYSPPLYLTRTDATANHHSVYFDVLDYQEECVAWQTVCTHYDGHGRCLNWQNQCVRWGYRTYRIQKRIDLNFSGMPALAKNESETYELQIQRTRPAGNGEDWVNTWFQAVSTKVPAIVTKWGAYQYTINEKKK